MSVIHTKIINIALSNIEYKLQEQILFYFNLLTTIINCAHHPN
jgi:hypothetical protein